MWKDSQFIWMMFYTILKNLYYGDMIYGREVDINTVTLCGTTIGFQQVLQFFQKPVLEAKYSTLLMLSKKDKGQNLNSPVLIILEKKKQFLIIWSIAWWDAAFSFPSIFSIHNEFWKSLIFLI